MVGKRFTGALTGGQANESRLQRPFCEKFGDKMKVAEGRNENYRIMALSVLGTKVWRFFWSVPCDVTPIRETLQTRSVQTSYSLFGALFTVRAGKLIDASFS
ncbi:hypothetical protein AVEN_113085-1 [Araneus ventricosus]|uniref:Uncharacterized protein n=1 Tax=Araneus ventricosus TaxID=182803 RepID=A0A4Y2DX09_ARAVE|nr:hypothetical protein AVEN_113085-1 [Araneus ventricosus]